MKILWFTWKDIGNPLAGGAEVVNQEICKRLAADGHQVTILTSGYPGSRATEIRNGYRIICVGNRFSVYFRVWQYYRKHLKGKFDLVIDEVNTMPFFASLYVSEPVIHFFHQLCREIWFYQMPFPLSLVGFLAEPVYLRILSGGRAVTVSESTRTDLIRAGFRSENISIISEGIRELDIRFKIQDLRIKQRETENRHGVPPTLKKGDRGGFFDIEAHSKVIFSSTTKFPVPTLLSLGAIRSMKRTAHIVRAFELAKAKLPNLRLMIAGDASGKYGQKVLRMIAASPHKDSITFHGKVDEKTKLELLRKSHLICVTSVKEGWGLIVTEANSQGTPAVAYNVDGLRDSIRNGKTGVLSLTPTPASLAISIIGLLSHPEIYEDIRVAAWKWSKEITFDRCYRDFLTVITKQVSWNRYHGTMNMKHKPVSEQS